VPLQPSPRRHHAGIVEGHPAGKECTQAVRCHAAVRGVALAARPVSPRNIGLVAQGNRAHEEEATVVEGRVGVVRIVLAAADKRQGLTESRIGRAVRGLEGFQCEDRRGKI